MEQNTRGSFLTILLVLVGLVMPIAAAQPATRITVTATLFPQYDFTRQIAGDKATVHLLLPPGAESHAFEPTPSDMRNISRADLFIYTGDAMEPWAKKLVVSAALSAEVMVVDASRGIPFVSAEHDEEDYTADGGEAHMHEFDPHIWLDPRLAAIMVGNIGVALAAKDPANAEYYQANAARIAADLEALDSAFAKVVAASSRRQLIFGERFAFGYFFRRYGLEMLGAYKSCAPGAEPGVKAVIEVVEQVKNLGVAYIYLEDMSTGRMAQVIQQETGVAILRVDSLHNPPAKVQAAGDTFQDIMRRNMQAFAKGLQ